MPIDFSSWSGSVLLHAVSMAQQFGAKLLLLHVVEPAVYPGNHLITPAAVDETNQAVIAASRERLEQAMREVRLPALQVEILVRVGRAHSEISDTAKATAADLIVMGTHGTGGLKQLLLGGTAERVLRNACCPVVMLRHQ